jgi:hypothetical protein
MPASKAMKAVNDMKATKPMKAVKAMKAMKATKAASITTTMKRAKAMEPKPKHTKVIRQDHKQTKDIKCWEDMNLPAGTIIDHNHPLWPIASVLPGLM